MFISIFVYLMITCFAKSAPNVCKSRIDSGFGIGEAIKTVNDSSKYCSYQGIPYAQPPIGERRFEQPEPFLLNETRIFNGLRDKCAQMNDVINFTHVTGTEDCLYLNVYSPESREGTEKFPVLFWIHGGSFVMGYAEERIFGQDFFIENGIVVVTVNYRLDVLGFLSEPKFGVSGNFGLKDQVEALKWVQRNIANFRGDPKKVTIMGWSAGGAAVTYHMYSKVSKGLFHQAISMSGVLTQPWAFSFHPEVFALKIMNNSESETKEKLKKASLNKLFLPKHNLQCIFTYFLYGTICFVPTLESENVNAFLTKKPNDLVDHPPINDVSMLLGYTNVELEHCFRDYLYRKQNPNYENRNLTVEKAIENYLDSTIQNMSLTLEQSIKFDRKFISEVDTMHGARYFIQKLAQNAKSPIYLYNFAFDGKFIINEGRIDANTSGARHGDELGYIFTPHNFNLALDNKDEFQDELLTLRRMNEMWSNFIKYGEPTPVQNNLIAVKWDRYNDKDAAVAGNYLHIDNELKMVKNDIETNVNYNIWDKAFKCLYFFECDIFNGWHKWENLTEN